MEVVGPHDGSIDGAVEPQMRHCLQLRPWIPIRTLRGIVEDVVVTAGQAAASLARMVAQRVLLCSAFIAGQ